MMGQSVLSRPPAGRNRPGENHSVLIGKRVSQVRELVNRPAPGRENEEKSKKSESFRWFLVKIFLCAIDKKKKKRYL
jgi:hypothetical protein